METRDQRKKIRAGRGSPRPEAGAASGPGRATRIRSAIASPQPMGPAEAASPRALERVLGITIRNFRRDRDMSIVELAAATGISNGMLSKIESGQTSASIATLQAIARGLQAPLSALFAASERDQPCSFVRANEGVTIRRRGADDGHIHTLLGHLLTSDVAVEPYLVTIARDAALNEQFHHEGTEFIHILEGRVRYRHLQKVYELGPGDSLLFDSGGLHGPEEVLNHPLKYLSVIAYPRTKR